MLFAIAGKNPLTAYWHLVTGGIGSWDRVVVGLNKSTPTLLCAFRQGVNACCMMRSITDL